MVKEGCQIYFCSVSHLMSTWHLGHLHQPSSLNSIYYSSEHSSLALLLLLSHPMELSKTYGHLIQVTCLPKIRISAVFKPPHLYRSAVFNVISVDYCSVSHAWSRECQPWLQRACRRRRYLGRADGCHAPGTLLRLCPWKLPLLGPGLA